MWEDMLRPVALLLMFFLIFPTAAYPQGTAPSTRKVSYAVFIDGLDPIYGEVTCPLERRCDLVDNTKPDLRLTIDAERTGDPNSRVRAYCWSTPCVLEPEQPSVDLRQTGKVLRFGLAEGRDPGTNAVMLYRWHIGQIVIIY
jgi:hypothetical protein